MSFLSIINNTTAIGAVNQLNINQYNLSRSIQRLSTGLRINTPADDVAGSALAARLQNKINIIEQGSINAQDGVSVVQVAQGGIGQIADLLNRLNTLATSAASAAKSSTDRANIQLEVNQILQQMQQIVNQTKFGDQNLLDGSIQGTQLGLASTLLISTNAFVAASGNSLVNNVGIATVSLTNPGSNATCFLDETFRIVITPSTVTGTSFIVNAFASGTVPAAGLQADVAPIATLIITPTGANGNALVGLTITSSAVGGATFVATLNFQGITVSDIANIVGTNAFVSTQAFQPAVTVDRSLLIQVGADVGEVDRIYASSTLPGNLFSSQNLNVGTILQAEGALNQIGHAIQIVSQSQAILGAVQNRFAAITANNATLTQNEIASKSRITDLNVAQETTNLTKEQILVQTANAMLAQANLLPQSLLQLFR